MSVEENTNVVMNSQNSINDLPQKEEEEDLLMSDFSMEDLPNFTIDQLLDLNIPLIPKPAPKRHDSSDDMFGSDDDLLQALEHDPSWDFDSQQTQQHLKENTIDSMDKIDTHMNNLDLFKDESIPSLNVDHDMVTLFSQDTNMEMGDEDTSTEICSQKLQDLDLIEESIPSMRSVDKIEQPASPVPIVDLIDEPTSSVQSVDTIKQSASSMPLVDVTEKPTSSIQPIDILPQQGPSVPVVELFEKDTSVQSENLIEQPTTSLSSVHTSKTPSFFSSRSSRPGISLRKRNAIQLKPFTLEGEQFKRLIGRTSAKSKLKDVINIKLNLDDDDSDTDFTPFDTQRVDEPIDEITTQELQSIGIRNKSTSNRKLEKEKPADPSSSHKKENNILHSTASTSSRTKETTATSSSSIPKSSFPSLIDPFKSNIENLEYPEQLEKYSLNKLIIPKKLKEKRKKIITFGTKKKKGKERSVLSRPTEVPKTDIFSFDFNAKAVPRSIPTVDLSLPLDDPDTESDEEVVFRRPRLNKRKVLSDDSEQEEEEEEEEGEPMSKEEIDKIFDFPTEPLGNLHVQRNRIENNSSIPIINDEYEYRDFKRQRIDIKDLHAKTLKNVLPASYLKLNEKKLKEELKNRELMKSARLAPNTKAFRKDKDLIARHTEDVFAAFREDTDNESDNGIDYNNNIEQDIVGHSNTIPVDQSRNIYYDDDSIFDYGDSMDFDQDVIYDHGDSVDYGFDDSIMLDNDMNQNTTADYNDEMEYNNTNSHHGIIDYTNSPNNRAKIDRYFIPAYKNRISNTPITRADTCRPNPIEQNSSNPHHIPRDSVDSTQAIECNRIPRQSTKSTGSSRRVQQTGNSRKPMAKFSTINKRPGYNNAGRIQSTISVRPVHNNAGPIQSRNNTNKSKRRKKPRRTVDDIFIHKPYYTSYTFSRINTDSFGTNQENNFSVRGMNNYRNQPGQNYSDNNNRTNYENNAYYKEFFPRRAYDDIYMNTTREPMYYHGDPIYIGKYPISEYLNRYVFRKESNNKTSIIYSLDQITHRIRNLNEPNINLIIGLSDTIYLHHRLLSPLISKNLKEKDAYSQFKETHSELLLFGKQFYWKQINSKQTYIIKDLFAKVFQDIVHVCSNDTDRINIEELSNHDYFYIFVSLCLTQWIPILPSQDKTELISLFIYLIRNLAYSVTKIIETQDYEKIQWEPIVKLLIYLLDWTCRIELLDSDRSIWSVTQYSQLMIDALVYIGFENIKENEYLIEAWICLILVVSVSNRKAGYHLNESLFLNQMTSSIHQKSRSLSHYEYKKRKTTQCWAETLDFILNKYFML